jgi:uncharacterized protein (DUF1684 family)
MTSQRSGRQAAVLVTILVAAACRGAEAPAIGEHPLPADHAAQVQAWRDKHDRDYRRDWVSIANLHFLENGSHTVGSDAGNAIVVPHVPPVIGTLVVADGKVTFEPKSGVAISQGDQPVTSTVVLRGGETRPRELVVGKVRLEIHESGKRYSLRVRDPDGEWAQKFLGFSWFPIDASYRVVGRFIRDPEPKKLSVLNTFEDEDTYTTEGVVEFTLHGRTLRLRPFTTRPKRFYFVFRDASGGHETYKTARFLYADLLDDGAAVLDFNEAYNPPCAFNPYTTCPIPLRENILPVKVLAGEKAYPVEVALPSVGR